MAVIQAQAYADDSGKEPPIYVFAGFVSSSAAWAVFSDEWQDALDNARPHKIPYMKMRDAYALQNHFRGFSESERDDLLRSLCQIINKHAQYGVSVVIDAEKYIKAFKDKIARTLDSPYFILNDVFVMSVIQAERQRGLTRTVDFIFDKQGPEEDQVEIYWELRKSKAPRWLRRRLGADPIWRSEEQFRPLQAADMLAWITRRAVSEGLSKNNIVERLDFIGKLHPFISELLTPIYNPPVIIEEIAQFLEDMKIMHGHQYETPRMRSEIRKNRARLFRS
jgi:hypothetical protein